MIAAVADDFTGAAEIAGIGRCYAMQTLLLRQPPTATCKADLVVLDTDSRLLSREQAYNRVAEMLDAARPLDVESYYKKTDSVFRGPVVEELRACMDVLQKPRALLLPANPSLGRMISGGRYFIDGVPLDETAFGHDPEYPARSSDVLELLGDAGPYRAHYVEPDQDLPPEGIAICAAAETGDVRSWASRLDERTLAAGGSDFFRAFLENLGLSPGPGGRVPPLDDALFVCGSVSDYSRRTVARAERAGLAVCRMPDEIFNGESPHDEALEKWADKICRELAGGRAIMAVRKPVVNDVETSKRLCRAMADAVERVMRRRPAQNILIEGGATASAVLKRMGWSDFEILSELSPGVVRMRLGAGQDRNLIVKPGSYRWPDGVLNV